MTLKVVTLCARRCGAPADGPVSPSDQLPELPGAAGEVAQDMPRTALLVDLNQVARDMGAQVPEQILGLRRAHACRRADNQSVGTSGPRGPERHRDPRQR